MKKFHKYNLTTINLPQGYRFIKRDEIYKITDKYWKEKRDGIENYMERSEQTPGSICSCDWPRKDSYLMIQHGYIRKIDEI